MEGAQHEVRTDQPGMGRMSRAGGVRKKPRPRRLNLKPREFESLGHSLLRERQCVVHEVPECRPDSANVRLQNDQLAFRGQKAVQRLENREQFPGIFEVLEDIARKTYVNRGGLDMRVQFRKEADQYLDTWPSTLAEAGICIYGDATPRLDRIDELSPARAEIKDGTVPRHHALEKMLAEFLP